MKENKAKQKMEKNFEFLIELNWKFELNFGNQLKWEFNFDIFLKKFFFLFYTLSFQYIYIVQYVHIQQSTILF